MPLVYADLRRPWAPTVWATDACETGIGVCSSDWALRSVSEVGSLDERWRSDDPVACRRPRWHAQQFAEPQFGDSPAAALAAGWATVPRKLLQFDRWRI
eukprot:10753139-Alexandrium_andersonii.AAC.1